MELSHVVYRVSTDKEYAAQFRADPEASVRKLGLQLNKEELASLLSVLGRADKSELSLGKRASSGGTWW